MTCSYAFNKTWLIRTRKHRLVRIKAYAFKGRYSCNKSGRWPLRVWSCKWGVAWHWGNVADARIKLEVL